MAWIKLNPTNAINITHKPIFISNFGPKRSMYFPAIRENITKPSGADNKTNPVCQGVNCVNACRK